MTQIVNDLAQAIRVADGQHKLGAGRLAEELLPVVERYANARAAAELTKVADWADGVAADSGVPTWVLWRQATALEAGQ